MPRQGTVPVRDYGPDDVEQMLRDAAALRARLFSPRPLSVVPPEPPEPREEPAPWVAPQVEREPQERDEWGRFIRATFDAYPQALVRQKTPEMRADNSREHPADVLEMILAVTGVHRAALMGGVRTDEVTRARHVACWLMVYRCGKSTPIVGEILGGRDHTSVLHGCKRVNQVAERLGVRLDQSSEEILRALWDAGQWPSVDVRGRRK